MRQILGSALLLLLVASPCASRDKGSNLHEVSQSVRLLLDDYARKDLAGVMALLSDTDVLIMGSDQSEICTSKAQAERLFRDDFKLWDSSSFGVVENVYSERSGKIVTAFFDVPFTFHRGQASQTVTVRFATVWKDSGKGLRLVQSMNTTPTVHQSARELTSGSH